MLTLADDDVVIEFCNRYQILDRLDIIYCWNHKGILDDGNLEVISVELEDTLMKNVINIMLSIKPLNSDFK